MTDKPKFSEVLRATRAVRAFERASVKFAAQHPDGHMLRAELRDLVLVIRENDVRGAIEVLGRSGHYTPEVVAKAIEQLDEIDARDAALSRPTRNKGRHRRIPNATP